MTQIMNLVNEITIRDLNWFSLGAVVGGIIIYSIAIPVLNKLVRELKEKKNDDKP
jgi:hypothetical protein